MRVGQPKEVVRVNEPTVPYEGDEVDSPQRERREETERTPETQPAGAES